MFDDSKKGWNIREKLARVENEIKTNERLIKNISENIGEIREIKSVLDKEFLGRVAAGTVSSDLLKLMEEVTVNLERLGLTLEQANDLSLQLVSIKEALEDLLDKEQGGLTSVGDERRN